VSCALPGYMYYADKFWPAEKELHIQQVKMEPLAVGQITDVRDISFLGDKTEIYHKSKPALMEIVEFMKMNPTVKIAVIGHVNGPDNAKSQKFYTKASLARAKAVVDFLVSQGISEDRLTSEGVGNTQMLYPDPQTEWQNDANRRIQIKVTEV
ncbi:MAG: OmpA family protein, partial [Bacteroidota bacterium]